MIIIMEGGFGSVLLVLLSLGRIPNPSPTPTDASGGAGEQLELGSGDWLSLLSLLLPV